MNNSFLDSFCLPEFKSVIGFMSKKKIFFRYKKLSRLRVRNCKNILQHLPSRLEEYLLQYSSCSQSATTGSVEIENQFCSFQSLQGWRDRFSKLHGLEIGVGNCNKKRSMRWVPASKSMIQCFITFKVDICKSLRLPNHIPDRNDCRVSTPSRFLSELQDRPSVWIPCY